MFVDRFATSSEQVLKEPYSGIWGAQGRSQEYSGQLGAVLLNHPLSGLVFEGWEDVMSPSRIHLLLDPECALLCREAEGSGAGLRSL